MNTAPTTTEIADKWLASPRFPGTAERTILALKARGEDLEEELASLRADKRFEIAQPRVEG